MRAFIRKGLFGVGLAAVVATGLALPASSAPALSNAASIKAAAPESVTDVRYRGRHRYHHRHRHSGWYAPGFVAGAVVVTPSYRYAERGYGNGYGYRCMTDEGQGRMRPCDAGGAR